MEELQLKVILSVTTGTVTCAMVIIIVFDEQAAQSIVAVVTPLQLI